jgi:hypothetical protein
VAGPVSRWHLSEVIMVVLGAMCLLAGIAALVVVLS